MRRGRHCGLLGRSGIRWSGKRINVVTWRCIEYCCAACNRPKGFESKGTYIANISLNTVGLELVIREANLNCVCLCRRRACRARHIYCG
jgi:hypothetical protein